MAATATAEGEEMMQLPVAAVPLMMDDEEVAKSVPSTSPTANGGAGSGRGVSDGVAGADATSGDAEGTAIEGGEGAMGEPSTSTLEVEVKAKGSAKEGVKRRYESWPGNETFFCGGACVTGPYYWGIVGTCLLILIPCVVFVVFVAWPLYEDLRDSDSGGGSKEIGAYVLLAVSIALPCLSLSSLFCSGCMDPGIIPRAPAPLGNTDHIARTRHVEVNGHMVLVRYNDTCNFYQPPRAHHCSVLNDCIERFDHYCPWVGTTIGKRNYRFYLIFVFSCTVLCVFTFACSAYLVKIRSDDPDTSVGEAIRGEPGALFMMAYVFIGIWFVGGLSGFHIYLLSRNQTTYENIRYSYDRNSANPYNKGCLANWAEVFCVRVPARNCDFTEVMPEKEENPTAAL